MDQLGFNNFRKFREFSPINLGDVNILVGANNSGKSTFVKAVMLVLNFIRNVKMDKNGFTSLPRFRFDVDHVNIGTYFRALCQDAKPSDGISFHFVIQHFIFDVKIKDEYKSGIETMTYFNEKDFAYLQHLKIEDTDRGVVMMFDFGRQNYEVDFRPTNAEVTLSDDKENYSEELEKLNYELTKATKDKDLEKIVDINNRITAVNETLSYHENGKSQDLNDYRIKLKDIKPNDEDNLILSLISCIIDYSSRPNVITMTNVRKQNKKEIADKQYLSDKRPTLEKMRKDLRILLKTDYEYIYAHGANQNVLFDSKNRNDYNAQTTHEFYSICGYEAPYEFVRKWTNELGIAKDFHIYPIDGEAYKVLIDDVHVGMNLADKGMGSVQLMTLLLRLAITIQKSGGFKNDLHKEYYIEPEQEQITPLTHTIVLIEEPEQNLHPAFQSRLADLFLEIRNRYGLRSIIETHSEYLIRRTQVIVAENNLSDNPPFHVFYFDDAKRFEMKYKANGRFDKKFGSGFYDEAGKMNMQLIMKERELGNV